MDRDRRTHTGTEAAPERPDFYALVGEGLLEADDRPVWDLLSDQRAARLIDVLHRRTRYVTLVLEAIYDGHNQAAVLRTADAFGVQDVTVAECGTRFAPHRGISQGAHKWLTLRRQPDIVAAVRGLQDRGYRVWASHLGPDSIPLEAVDLSEPAAFVFGNEHAGVSADAREAADGNFVIPMAGFVQSMNISVAAAVTLYHATACARRLVGPAFDLPEDDRRAVLQAWLRQHMPRGRPLPR